MSTIQKAIHLLSLVAENRPPPRFTELLKVSGHPKATLHRLLATLIEEGLVTLDEHTQTYRPGLRLLELAHHSWASLDLRAVAADDVDHLSRTAGETAQLAILDETDIVYIDKRESEKSLRIYSAVGKRAPLYCTGIGKAVLAFLPDEKRERLLDAATLSKHTETTITDREKLRTELAAISHQGYALDMEEHEQGIRCVAAPIRGRDAQVVGGISLTALAVRLDPERLNALQPLVVDAAARISYSLSLLH